jgi:hypothetical protein
MTTPSVRLQGLPELSTYFDRAIDVLIDADARGVGRVFGYTSGRNYWNDRACLRQLRSLWFVNPDGTLTDVCSLHEPYACAMCGDTVSDYILDVEQSHACCACGWRDPAQDAIGWVCPSCNQY